MIADLFRRSTQMATAIAIKNRAWNPIEYAEFLTAVSQRPAKLHADTVAAIQGPLRNIQDPIIRTLCVDSVEKMGSLNVEALKSSYLKSGDLEAIADLLPSLGKMQISDLESLVLLNAHAELCDAITAGVGANDSLWCQAFKWAVENDYNRTTKLWKHRPPSSKLSQSLAYDFMAQAGRHQDPATVKQIAEAFDLPVTRVVAAAVLNSVSKSSLDVVLTALHELEGLATPHDAEHAGEVLAENARQVLQLELGPLATDSLLNGLYRRNSSQTVFHVYRLLRNRGFIPTQDTFQILANAAYRMGNSKITSYHIWKEAESFNSLTRKLSETVLFCQLIGPSYRTVLFYLHEMKTQNIYLRSHVQRRLYKKFESIKDGSLVAIFNDIRSLDRYAQFDMDLAIEESKPYDRQAIRNAQVYLEGQRPAEDPLEVLESMLAFDRSATQRS